MRDWVGSIESAQPREDLVPVGCVSRADGWLGLGLEVGRQVAFLSVMSSPLPHCEAKGGKPALLAGLEGGAHGS